MEGNGISKLEKPDYYKILGIPPTDAKIIDGLPQHLRTGFLTWWGQSVNLNLMHQIGSQMKETPFLSSEIPPKDDYNPLIKAEFPEEGGVLTYMENYDLPYRGFPLAEIVEKIDVIKKISRASLSGLYHSLKNRWFLLITLIPSILVFRDLMGAGIYTFWKLIDRFKMKPLRLSQCMRELHRSFSLERKESIRIKELKLMMRDLVCNVLEFDNAYRFRAQDILEELSKKNLQKNPIKELKRLIVIAQSRELTQEIRDTWKLVKLFISFYLRFDRQLLNLFKDVLLNLNIEQFKLTPEDKQFCVKRKDYIFGFMK